MLLLPLLLSQLDFTLKINLIKWLLNDCFLGQFLCGASLQSAVAGTSFSGFLWAVLLSSLRERVNISRFEWKHGSHCKSFFQKK